MHVWKVSPQQYNNKLTQYLCVCVCRLGLLLDIQHCFSCHANWMMVFKQEPPLLQKRQQFWWIKSLFFFFPSANLWESLAGFILLFIYLLIYFLLICFLDCIASHICSVCCLGDQGCTTDWAAWSERSLQFPPPDLCRGLWPLPTMSCPAQPRSSYRSQTADVYLEQGWHSSKML